MGPATNRMRVHALGASALCDGLRDRADGGGAGDSATKIRRSICFPLDGCVAAIQLNLRSHLPQI
jgi:hypothetical protein